MSRKTVNHKARKREIRAVGLGLFARHGFDDVNFGMIAEAAGISRTLLYTYFRDKRQIFNEAIDEATAVVGTRYREIARSRLSADAKLRQICIAVFALLFDNRDFLCVIVDFLATVRRGGKIPVDNVMRHTVGLRRILHSFVVEAVRRGEYDPSLNAHRATALLYSQFEAVVLRLTLSGRAELSESVDATNAILFSFRVPAAGVPRFL
ncbi:MAG: TetR/AcrR family transcriptional regulator [Kiritimatiellia bacterium]